MSAAPSPTRPRHSAQRHSAGWRFARRGRAERRKWSRRKRIVVISTSIVGILALLAGAAFGYAWWRYDEIPKVTIPGLTPRTGNNPFNILLVGSDSRAFAGDTGANAAAYGASSAVGGQRSDVIIVARVVPATHQVHLLSIPRDTWVDIPGHVADISGYNRINAAYNNGPQLLVQTVVQTFHIPISDYVDINFEGLVNMVNAIGGVYLDFKDPVYDTDSHLGITKTGCHLVLGAQALALVRSRHLYYKTDGVWHYDGLSDWSRIQRQDAFFRALLPRLRGVATNPISLNSFLGAADKNITIDSTISEGTLLSLANIFRHTASADLVTETLPTAPYTVDGQAVVVPAPSEDSAVITSFLKLGTTASATAYHPATSTEGTGVALLTSLIESSVSVSGDSGIPTPSPGDIVTNTQLEPWNPTPCQPGG